MGEDKPEDKLDKPAQGLMARLGRWLERDHTPTASEVAPLFTARLTDVAANRLAKQWSTRYDAADGKERRTLLAVLAQASGKLEPRGDQGQRLFKRLYAQAESLRLLVDLRADMLRWRNQVSGLSVMERELEGLLSSWFDVGMLELRPINWDSPASLLEKLIQYEAVHEIRSWEELKHRVADDRRCYAFFHPRMSDVPLIFVEVAFAAQMAGNVQLLLDPHVPSDSPEKARWAIFYSISNTQPGLRGISFGNFLLKRVIDALLAELPRLKSFATLSPIPGFADWLSKQDGKALQDLLHDKADKQAAVDDPDAGSKWVQRLQAAAAAGQGGDGALQRTGLRLAVHYLRSMKGGQPLDPVARFHLGNGARIERVNWAADCSAKGMAQSCGIMTNYLYELDQLDDNLAQLAEGKPKMGLNLRWR
ncbi:malonyl-CoA decarboxylase domain-containing protein [Allopusillimonas ginsengisoli]|uniref:malonyl-CoA decarboxylase domain-containing protein n=1 Tax=Allopusillimonas ginsengisoli TaxID=453575 RepID=UPI0010224E56|nr:malonyl-CoA decarboxylase family protein [Allopusillimonas ginsengisoli]TEA80275.1 malonyl-CoA decarboxylase [Allopusillimonas ginsengisoli]